MGGAPFAARTCSRLSGATATVTRQRSRSTSGASVRRWRKTLPTRSASALCGESAAQRLEAPRPSAMARHTTPTPAVASSRRRSGHRRGLRRRRHCGRPLARLHVADAGRLRSCRRRCSGVRGVAPPGCGTAASWPRPWWPRSRRWVLSPGRHSCGAGDVHHRSRPARAGDNPRRGRDGGRGCRGNARWPPVTACWQEPRASGPPAR